MPEKEVQENNGRGRGRGRGQMELLAVAAVVTVDTPQTLPMEPMPLGGVNLSFASICGYANNSH